MEKMVPHQTNKTIAEGTVQELLYPVPKFFELKQLGKKLVAAAMDNHVRNAMMWAFYICL